MTAMSKFATCVVLEEGIGFLETVLLSAVVLAVIFIVIAKHFGLRPPKKGGGTFSMKFKTIVTKATGSTNTALVAILLIAVAFTIVFGALYLGYKAFRGNYSVAWDSSVGVPLEHVREQFQNDTQAVIMVSDAAKQLRVKGSYVASCVPDLFQAICRQYAQQLSCETSRLQRRITVTTR
jgi:hypothetical protein